MPISLPAEFSAGFTLPDSGIKITDVAKTINTAKQIWDAQSFADLLQGKIKVPDTNLNEALAAALEENKAITAVKVTSLENHKLEIQMNTAAEGRVVLVCVIEELLHNPEASRLKLKVVDKKLPDKPFVSWIFSKISLAMACKIAGQIDPGAGLAVAIRGNEVTVDFKQALATSTLGQFEIMGYRPLSLLTISSAVPQKGYIEIDANLDLPDTIKTMISNVL